MWCEKYCNLFFPEPPVLLQRECPVSCPRGPWGSCFEGLAEIVGSHPNSHQDLDTSLPSDWNSILQHCRKLDVSALCSLLAGITGNSSVRFRHVLGALAPG